MWAAARLRRLRASLLLRRSTPHQRGPVAGEPRFHSIPIGTGRRERACRRRGLPTSSRSCPPAQAADSTPAAALRVWDLERPCPGEAARLLPAIRGLWCPERSITLVPPRTASPAPSRR